MPKPRVSKLFQAVFLLSVVGSVFAYTVALRAPFFGRYAGFNDGLWRINSEYALKAVLNWITWGPVAMKWRIQIGFEGNPAGYGMYASYPPLYVILPWLVSKISGIIPTIRTLNAMSLAAQFAFGIATALWANTLCRLAGLELPLRTLLASAAGAFLLATPSCVFFFQNDWWPDLLVLPFFTLVAWLELEAPLQREKRWFPYAFAAVLALALLSDWVAAPLGAVIWLKRRFDRSHPEERKHWAELVVPYALLLLFLIYAVYDQGLHASLIEKFKMRLGVGDSRFFFPILGLFLTNFGSVGYPTFVAGAALLPVFWILFLRVRSPEIRSVSGAAVTLFLPLYLHLLVTRQHYIDHTYAWTKFALVTASLPFVLLPALSFRAFPQWRKFIALAATLAAVTYGGREFPLLYQHGLDPGRHTSLPENTARSCEALVPLHRFNDVYVSPNFATVDLFTPPAPSDPLLSVSLACYLPIQRAATPERAAELEWISRWLGATSYYRPRVVAIFRGAPSAQWRPYLREGTLRRVADLELYDFRHTPSGVQ